MNSKTLCVHQKRQATLLYYFSSIEFLNIIIQKVCSVVAFSDRTLDYAKRVERDKAMQTLGWDEADLSANWSTHAHPMLQDCLRGLLAQMAARVTESYDISGVRSALTGMSYFSINWTLPEEENTFKKLAYEANAVGMKLDATVQHTFTDYDMAWIWNQYKGQFPRLPKFRIRKDVECETGTRPIRTGVYVPQDDPFGTLQFGWTGNPGGALGKCDTLSALAIEYVGLVGREKLWTAPNSRAAVPGRVTYTDEYFDDWCREEKGMTFPDSISSRNERAFVHRHCKWHFVEMIADEFEDATETESYDANRIRCEPGQVVPCSGWWYSPAFPAEQSLRHFEHGTKFPDTRVTEWGAVFWQYDPDRQR